jgi:DNA-binding beta-propeller fold protein YncE
MQTRSRLLAGLGLLVGLWACAPVAASGAPPLVLERTIPLAKVGGRIDHLAIDPQGRRLFVAELGAGSVEAIDLATGRSAGRIEGLKEPQGLGYLPSRGELVVATGGDGMVRFYRGADLSLLGALKLGEDADNVRVDHQTDRLVAVGYGKALAVIDPASRAVVRTIPLPAHPEGFQMQQDRAFVNLPEAGAVAALDLAHGRETARWRNPGPHFNFPLALDKGFQKVAVVYRLPARLVIFDAASGHVDQTLDTCGDADDVFFNREQNRLYVICGGGAVDVFDRLRTGYAPARRVQTRPGARTGLYSEALDRLFVAARAHGGEGAAILVFRPVG